MNLYKVNMTHAAPKDSETAIKEYVVAKNDYEVFNYLKSEGNYTYWNNVERYNEDYDDDLKKIDFIYKNRGDSQLEEKWQDLYYGSTIYDWELFIENISQPNIDVLHELEIAKVLP